MTSAFTVRAIFWYLAGILACGANQQCGRPALPENRIVGGMDASDGAWPWQVDIQESNRHVCGGSIISDSWVLSAAHCFPNPFDVGSYVIYAGRYQLNGYNPYQSLHRVKRVVLPSGYIEPDQGKDLALVELTAPVSWSDHIRPICLPDSDTLFPSGMTCYVTGWGYVRDGVPLSGIGTLQVVEVPIISRTSCQEMYQLHPSETVDILSDMICAGYPQGGKDSCQGDSGGPLVCPMVNGTWVQAGVVSFGLSCAQANQPGVYAKVSSFSYFIRQTLPDIKLYGTGVQHYGERIVIYLSTLATLLITLLMS